MIDITKETLEDNDREVIVDVVNSLWLNGIHIEEQLGYKNLPAITLNGIKIRVFFGKIDEKKHLCCHDKNHYYF